MQEPFKQRNIHGVLDVVFFGPVVNLVAAVGAHKFRPPRHRRQRLPEPLNGLCPAVVGLCPRHIHLQHGQNALHFIGLHLEAVARGLPAADFFGCEGAPVVQVSPLRDGAGALQACGQRLPHQVRAFAFANGEANDHPRAHVLPGNHNRAAHAAVCPAHMRIEHVPIGVPDFMHCKGAVVAPHRWVHVVKGFFTLSHQRYQGQRQCSQAPGNSLFCRQIQIPRVRQRHRAPVHMAQRGF